MIFNFFQANNSSHILILMLACSGRSSETQEKNLKKQKITFLNSKDQGG